jgi:protein-disulfide isomerase
MQLLRRPSLETLVSLGILIACLMLIGERGYAWWLAWDAPARAVRTAGVTPSPRAELPTRSLSLNATGVKGASGANVALIIYSDFQCPFCVRFAKETLPALESEYVATGKVQIVFRHMPIASIHPMAESAAAAAECAGDQGRFWEMHDRLLEQSRLLTDATFMEKSRALRLDEQAFQSCLSTSGPKRVARDLQEARELHVTSTPTFLVAVKNTDGTAKVVGSILGARPLSVFKAALDSAASRRK